MPKNNTIEYQYKKNLFIKTLNDLKRQKEINDKFYEATRDVDLLGNGFLYNTTLLEDNILQLLLTLTKHPINIIKKFPDSKYENNTIEWWVYETNFGQDKYPYISNPNDNNVFYKLLTPENLWDYLNDEFNNLTQVTKEELKKLKKF